MFLFPIRYPGLIITATNDFASKTLLMSSHNYTIAEVARDERESLAPSHSPISKVVFKKKLKIISLENLGIVVTRDIPPYSVPMTKEKSHHPAKEQEVSGRSFHHNYTWGLANYLRCSLLVQSTSHQFHQLGFKKRGMSVCRPFGQFYHITSNNNYYVAVHYIPCAFP